MSTITTNDFGDETLELFNEAKQTGDCSKIAKALIDSDFTLADIREFLKKELKFRKKDFDFIAKMYL